ncbi:TIGR03086 family metal-binding protein [Mycolicibacter arupensis]|jgi:uncharacterized protein (TIGR03086 family)|uniref:TIGR03086 family protein n=1 Tax=Mycolicibacter arupensis TaxID=342002 RepID=A0A5C7XKC3_9MYCO|nr:TIGR03086 family metal-binding protein [Mycolicibacter arupensis]TXI49922.1 MAG: TIGR03086 family protein [Mycolicibacter arupensis]
MDELARAQLALAALRPVLAGLTDQQLRLPTPCPGFDVAALGDHLTGTIAMVGAAAGAAPLPPGAADDAGMAARVAGTATTAIEAWRRRGTAGEAQFGDRLMPAALALGVLSIELVVHGWDFAQALHRPFVIAAEHSTFVLGLARRIITPESRRTAGFDDPVTVGTDAAALDRLVAYTGRRPPA